MTKHYISPIETSNKESVQEKLNVLKNMRKGKVKATVDGIPGRCVPIMTADCLCCGKPSPAIIDGRFICRKCVMIFPVRKGIIFTEEGFKHVSESKNNSIKSSNGRK